MGAARTARLPRRHPLQELAGRCWLWHAHSALTPAGVGAARRRRHLLAQLRDARGGGARAAASTRAGAQASRDGAAGGQAAALCGRYNLRVLPLRPYDGATTFRVSWLLQNSSCALPD